MTHQLGDSVTNRNPIGDDIPAGTRGTITFVAPDPFGTMGVTYDTHPNELAMWAHEIKADTP